MKRKRVIHEHGDWKDYRRRLGLLTDDEINLHFGERTEGSYDEAMARVGKLVMDRLRKAQETGRPYLMFIHGWSTSGRGRTTARSVVRSCMRSKEATPLIVRAQSIQHDTVFVAKIKFPVPQSRLVVTASLST